MAAEKTANNGSDRQLILTGSGLTLSDVVATAYGQREITLAPEAWRRVTAGRKNVDRIVAQDIPAYGITTGVGSQKDYRISVEEFGDYNARLVRAHGSRGPGARATPAMLRGALTIQLNSFATGAAGVRPEVVTALLAWLREDVWPDVRLGQSVGASDLMALAQLTSAFLARCRQASAAGDPGQEKAAIAVLAPKEGLSFLNSNGLTLAQGALALTEVERLLRALNMTAALTLEGFRGNPGAWSERSDRLHPQAGQQIAGRHLRRLLENSGLWQPDEPRFLQDPLSLRCVPQTHGACYAALVWVQSIWEAELNTVVDNPAIDLEKNEAFSHGNMETTLLAVCLDALRAALAKAIEASGERLHKTQWPAFSGLPTGLAAEGRATGGVQFLSLGHLGAANVSAAKIAAMPVTPHYSGQICDGVEDIGGLAPFAVAQCEQLLAAAWNVAAVEAIVGVWAIARRGISPDHLGAGLRQTFGRIKARLPMGHEGEQLFDIEPVIAILKDAER
jgi:histidine ammonia-lyase